MLGAYQNSTNGTPLFQTLIQRNYSLTTSPLKNVSVARNLEFQDLIKLRRLEEYSHSSDCLEFSVADSYVLEEGGNIVAAIMAQKVQGVLQVSSLFMENSLEGTQYLQELVKYIRLNCALSKVRKISFRTDDQKVAQTVQGFLGTIG